MTVVTDRPSPGGVSVSSDGTTVAVDGTTSPDVHVIQAQLWLLDLASREAHPLPAGLVGPAQNGPGLEFNFDPAWFPRERRDDVWIAKNDGRHLRRLARNAQGPSWAPTGRRVAFASLSLAHGTSDVVTADLNGRHRRTIAHNATFPVFSPDGRLIAFDRCSKCQPDDSESQVMTVRLSGRATRVLYRENPHRGTGFTAMDWQALPR